MKYNSHYKDRAPEETIQIIKDFFNNINLTTKVSLNIKSEGETYSTGIDLYFNNFKILSSNGKGISEKYALASGYAELYERFCANIYNNLYNYIPLNKNNKNINKKENVDYILLKNLNKKNKDIFYKISNNTNKKLKYININNADDQIYIFNSTISNIKGSGGLCAGNEFYEAMNQGLSELVEHYITGQLLNFPEDLIYHTINLDIITNPTLIKIINKIRQNPNQELYIYDFSYNYNVPVLMSLLLNKTKHTVSIDIGAFPIFDIALERTLTEIYQGVETRDINYDFLLYPYKEKEKLDLYDITLKQIHCVCDTFIINENILLNTKEENNINKNVFLLEKNNYNNKEIYEYFLKLCKSLNINMYYHDNSLSSKIQSYQIFSDNFPQFPIIEQTLQNDKDKNLYFYYNILLLNLENKILQNNKYDDILNKILYFIKNNKNFNYGLYESWSIYLPFSFIMPFNLFFIYNNFYNDTINIVNQYIDTIYYPYLHKYGTILNYSRSTKYTQEEKLAILKKLNYNISKEELEQVKDIKYFIQKCFLEPYKNFYNSKECIEYRNKIKELLLPRLEQE